VLANTKQFTKDYCKRMPTRKETKVLFLCPYPFDVAPSQRLKFEQYYPSFREAGYRVTHSSFITSSFWKIVYKKGQYLPKTLFTVLGYCMRCWDLLRIPFYDVVYVHLWVTPFGPPLFERMVRLLAKRVVYDIDDMIYLREQKSKANPVISSLKGKGKPIYLFKNADAVLTSTDAIQRYASSFNDNVVNIPISVDTEVYRPGQVSTGQRQKFTIGWTGSLSTSPYLHLLDNVLRELSKDFDFRLVVMGDPGFSIEGVDVEAIPWRADYEVATIAKFDIGLYPLPDEHWVFGKGGGKALQYMSLGVPTVATAIAYNLKIITNGENGFLVNTESEWKEVIAKLILDKSLRESIGKNAIQTVVDHYSVHANKAAYLSLISPED
jgi:L-malate glycosyltransferase